MPERYVSRAEIARQLRLSERQITTLVRDAKLSDGRLFPSRVAGARRTFPEDRCFAWYLDYKREEALQRAAGKQEQPDLAEAELRKAIADAEITEHKLARLRGEVVLKIAVRQEFARWAGRIMARLMSAPNEHAHSFTEPATMARATDKLKVVMLGVAAELQRSADGPIEPEEYEEDVAA